MLGKIFVMQRFIAVLAGLMLVPIMGCPATTLIELRNQSPGRIEILYQFDDTVLASIDENETDTVNFHQNCFRVRVADTGQIIGFLPAKPPDSYLDVRTSHVRIYGVFREDGVVEILPRDGREGIDPRIALEVGCDR